MVKRLTSADATQQNPNHAKCCSERIQNAQDICDRKFVPPIKCGPKFTKNFLGDASAQNS